MVVITCSIHSSETASTLMAMELLHELATRDDPATARDPRQDDRPPRPLGQSRRRDKVARWYERSKGHPWEGSGMPELYHDYAGHDTNRDWFMLNLKETRLLTRLLYKEWFPTILYDVHQMGLEGRPDLRAAASSTRSIPTSTRGSTRAIAHDRCAHGERPGGGGQAWGPDSRDVRQLVERRQPHHAPAAQHRGRPHRGGQREARLARSSSIKADLSGGDPRVSPTTRPPSTSSIPGPAAGGGSATSSITRRSAPGRC